MPSTKPILWEFDSLSAASRDDSFARKSNLSTEHHNKTVQSMGNETESIVELIKEAGILGLIEQKP